MGFRFRRTFTILPGIKVNLGKEGLSSVSFGRRGAKMTVGKNGTRQTVGLPGSGLSFTNYEKHAENEPVPVPAAMDNRASLRCPNCNAITKRGAIYCPKCGFNLHEQLTETIPEEKPIYKYPIFWLWIVLTFFKPTAGILLGLAYCAFRFIQMLAKK